MLLTNYHNFFLGRNYFTSNDRSQNTFVYQPTLDTLELTKVTDSVITCKSKGVFSSKLKPLFTVFFNSITLSEYKIGIKFDKDPLALDQNNHLIKIVNVFIVYDLDAWPKNPTDNFKIKNCLFGATNIVKNSDKEKYVYSGYRIIFDSGGFWSFDNDTAKKVK